MARLLRTLTAVASNMTGVEDKNPHLYVESALSLTSVSLKWIANEFIRI